MKRAAMVLLCILVLGVSGCGVVNQTNRFVVLPEAETTPEATSEPELTPAPAVQLVVEPSPTQAVPTDTPVPAPLDTMEPEVLLAPVPTAEPEGTQAPTQSLTPEGGSGEFNG